MILLIDIGNTRIKWGAYEAGHWCEKGTASSGELASLFDQWSAMKPSWLGISNVAGRDAAEAIEQSGLARGGCFFLVPEAEAHGIGNGYSTPAALGSDRYAALIAASKMNLGNVIVASLGTALTADALSAEGGFLGGIITPGYRAMRQGIAMSTQGVRSEAGHWSGFPLNTDDALETGILSALVGAIEAQRLRLETLVGVPATVLLTGGDAGLIRPLLREPVRMVEDMVLEGLLWVAREKGVVAD